MIDVTGYEFLPDHPAENGEDYVILPGMAAPVTDDKMNCREVNDIRLAVWFASCSDYRAYMMEGVPLCQVWDEAGSVNRAFILGLLTGMSTSEVDRNWLRSLTYNEVKALLIAEGYTEGWDAE
jgi:hypothetical protein